MSEVAPGVWSPMDFVTAWDPLQGGYAFLDRTDGGVTAHPAVDLNATIPGRPPGGDADLGAALRFPVAGEVVYVGSWNGYATGYGNNLWLRLDSGDYLHYCHCDTMDAWVGMRGVAGQAVATCGRSGYQMWAHCHLEVKREDPATAGYEFWPYGLSADYVRQHYVRPADWWAELLAWAQQQGEELPMDTTPEERAALKPYFDTYGQDCNMETALMKRAALAYKRDESRGPALSGEYPYGGYVRQQFSAGIGEYHPDDGLVYWVEVVKEGAA